jgi:uncharacterized MnhB-related membrane protein
MATEQIFGLLNLFILPGWLLLLFAPRWRWTHGLIMSGIYSALYALAYILLMGMAIPDVSLDFGSLASVAELFRHPLVLLAGWTHYLAFDLFVGAWLLKDSQALGRRHLLMVPILCLTFYLGPLGFVLYMGSKYLSRGVRRMHMQ